MKSALAWFFAFAFALSLPPEALAAGAELDAWDFLLPLLIVLAAGALAWWLVHRRGWRASRQGPIEILHVLPLGTRERLLLVRVRGRTLLLGITPNRIGLVERFDDTEADRGGPEADPAEDARRPPRVDR